MDYIFLAECADGPGISAAVTGCIADMGAFITDSSQFSENGGEKFFLRIAFRIGSDKAPALAEVRRGFESVAARFAMRWSITDAAHRPRTLIAVSRFGHCLNDLLHRWKSGGLPVEVVGVVSNHADLRSLAEWHGLPFHHLPITAATKAEQEKALLALVDESEAELIVLARYMQILSQEMAAALSGRCINIHHSFLPSFKGAKPYHQAFDRGVKLIGATAHYVTDDLDEGPIIEQDVERVDHSWPAAQLVEAGQDIEARVLARAVRWHAQKRVLLNGNKTIVFR